MSTSPPAVILLSGGLDSATTLAIARERGFACHTLCIDYGQRHRHELTAAVRVAAHLHAKELKAIRVDLGVIGGSALTSDIEVPKAEPGTPPGAGIPLTYVPARNLIFLSIAAAWAEVLRAGDLFIGVNAVDYSGYPDCRPEFIRAFSHAAKLGTRSGTEGRGVTIHAPLMALSKAAIIREGARLGVDYSLTHSCYDPAESPAGPLACARCDSCRIRALGFAEAGIPDPTRYGQR